ncbi:MAG TPA: PmoA family protein [Candidatus Paceibacterota bacterium]|nr:PmoA family protein [Verrucomicrobiota bacterium]HRY47102.1 PmoA family protein [Candidatus Paceibacterota bacterium]HSA00496.1 PmoA family protein [Candidatus Paceibacterota bacterium]
MKPIALLFFTGLVHWSLQSVAAGPVLQIQPGANDTSILRDGRLAFVYRSDATLYKPYVALLTTPSGLNILRDAPADHAHHHGLMFALTANDVDFWGEKVATRPGKQVRTGVPQYSGRGDISFSSYSLRETLQWQDATNGEVLVNENRRVEFHRLAEDSDCHLVTWQSVLTPAADKGSVVLSGHHYFGLGMRFAESMDIGGEFLYADSETKTETVRGDERLARSRWCAFQGLCQGKPVTVAMFDLPSNPRQPATWFTMQKPFVYLSATMDVWRAPFRLSLPQPLAVTYGVAVWDGHVLASQVEVAYRKWLLLLPEELVERQK